MDNRGMVIVGAGHAGCRAAKELRAGGWQGPLALVNGEDRPPYERPPLSKGVLTGAKRAGDATLLGPAWFRENDIDYREGAHAASVDRNARTVALSDGSTLTYGKLLLAPGAEPRPIELPGKSLRGVVALRSALDAEHLCGRLAPGLRVLVIGGGLIGLEVAASAVQRGCSVVVVEAGTQLLMRVAPSLIATAIKEVHVRSGVSFRMGRQATRIVGRDIVEAVDLDDGERVPCDIVLLSVGAVPRATLASDCGLEVRDGIVVDEFLQTSDPDIFAAGDACRFRDADGRAVRLESWRNAEEQGALVAGNMLGGRVAYRSLPWMWSDQYDHVLQVAGAPERGSRTVVRAPSDDATISFHLAPDGALTGVTGFGPVGVVAKAVRVGQEMIARGVRPDPSVLADAASDLRASCRARAA